MPGISIHVVDVALGKPAAGMFVEVHALDAGEGVTAGTHEVLLHAGEYFRFVGQVTSKPAFQEIVPLRFTVLDVREHYHLPVKISPWGIAVWRGA